MGDIQLIEPLKKVLAGATDVEMLVIYSGRRILKQKVDGIQLKRYG